MKTEGYPQQPPLPPSEVAKADVFSFADPLPPASEATSTGAPSFIEMAPPERNREAVNPATSKAVGATAMEQTVTCPYLNGHKAFEGAPAKGAKHKQEVPFKKKLTKGEHNRVYGPVGKELEHVSGVVNKALAAKVREKMASSEDGDPVSAWARENVTTEVIELPVGDADDLRADPYRELPSTFFNDADGKLQQPVIPKTWLGRRKLIKQHEARMDDLRAAKQAAGDAGDYVEQTKIRDRINSQQRSPSQLREALSAMRRAGVTIDAESWQKYADAAANADPDKVWIDVEGVVSNRNGNVQSLLGRGESARRKLATGRFKSYIYQGHKAGRFNRFATSENAMIMPVGEYGPEFAEVLLQGSQYTMAQAEKTSADVAGLAKSHQETLGDHTARGRDAAESGGGGPENGLIDTVQEGVATAGHALALLTAEKIEGYDDPMALLRDIKKAGLINKLTNVIPMGIVGPFAMAGAFPKGLVQKHEGTLRLNPDVLQSFKEVRDKQVKFAIGEWAVRRFQRNKKPVDLSAERIDEEMAKVMGFSKRVGSLGMICPAARRGGGLEEVSDSMIDAMLATEQNEKVAA